MRRFHFNLKKKVIIRRKKRYQRIQPLSRSKALFRAIAMMVESWILGEKARWDYQYAKTQSPIERKVYNALRGKYPLKTQVPCGAYSIDIAIPRYRIAIETDGHSNHSTPEQKARDQRKDRYLKAHGWMVLRFSGSEVNGKLKWVLAQIHQHVEACRSPRRPRTMQAMRKAAKRKMIKREGK